jgi:hypothetical protein
MEARRFVRRRCFHILYTIGSQMVVRLPALRAGRPLPPGIFLVLITVIGWVDPWATVRLQGLGQLKNPIDSSRIEPATFRLVAWSLDQLRYRVSHSGSGQHYRSAICSYLLKAKICLCLCTTPRRGAKGVEIKLHLFSASELDVGCWISSRWDLLTHIG